MNSRILPFVALAGLGAVSFFTLLAGGGPGDSLLPEGDTGTLLMVLATGVLFMMLLARFVPPMMQSRRHRKAERMRALQQMQHSVSHYNSFDL